ncbi:lipase [Phycomyces blakesleeanus]|uniref:Lipase n=1 Tax=Phycomyces blakesleeanus TaxID=4837 RepID=A0ABR3AU11_PHYBL
MAAPVQAGSGSLVARGYILPPVITSRATIPGTVPEIDFDAEVSAEKLNGPLAAGTESKEGIAMNATSVPSRVRVITESSDSGIFATTQQINELKLYTALAANSYCRTVVPLNIWACPHCSKDDTLVKSFSSLIFDTSGFIVRNDKAKTINLSFRGTNSIRSFITDIELVSQPYPPVKGARLHTGFYNSYLEVQNIVVSSMIDQITKYSGYKVTVSGHSLGGAVAVISAMDLYQRDTRFTSSNLVVYTFGSPRIGNKEFAYYAAGTGIKIQRVVNNRDIIPHLLPQAIGYYHNGDEYWIKSNKAVKICNTVLDSRDCSNSIVPFTSVLDHLSYFGVNTGLCL